MEKIPDHYRRLSEREARNKFRPSPVMNQLRASFWVEYNVAQSTHQRKMKMERVAAGICTHQYWENVVCYNKEMVAYMLIPPQTYQAVLNESWHASMDRMREILDLPLYDKKGKLSVATANLLVRVWTLLDQRKHGAVVQRNVNVNIEGSQNDLEKLVESVGTESLDTRLELIKKKLENEEAKSLGSKEAQEIPDPIEALNKSIDELDKHNSNGE